MKFCMKPLLFLASNQGIAKPMKIEKTDLHSITRSPDKCRSFVWIVDDDDDDHPRHDWLVFGEADLRARDNGKSWLEAYLNNATDFEHDSAFALRIPLVGLQFVRMRHSSALFRAWVDPNGYDEFYVPLPGYNPLEHKDTVKCDGKRCGYKHFIVPEDLYVPPFNKELYEAVRGKEIQIRVGPNWPKQNASQ